MTSLLKHLFSCCYPKRQASDLQEDTSNTGDIIYITVPRKDFYTYLSNPPQHWKLDPTDFMALYRYTTDEIVSYPGPDYKYEKFAFLVDGEYVRIEGWVPIPDIFTDIKAARNAICVLSGPSQKAQMRGRDVICANIKGKMTKAEQIVGVQKIYTAAVPKSSKKAELINYSRHMSDFEVMRQKIDKLNKS